VISKTKLWNLIAPLIAEEGLELFDVELPGAGSGALRIFVTRPNPGEGQQSTNGDGGEAQGRTGVNLDDCARISRKLGSTEEFDEILPERTTLEVSSPGINRRLRRDEHFAGAIGEHIHLKVHGEENKVFGLKGILKEFHDGVLQVEEDGSQEMRSVSLSDVNSARVDFIFD
jgi:ribosome maturation factor RimP